MKFLADMGISQSTIIWLRRMGHNAIHLRDEGLQKISDAEVIRKAREEDRIILTCDLDFGDLMASSGGMCPSIIIFRLENEAPENVNRRLAQVLKESSDALQRGTVISVEETRHRVRLLPI
jgi:predicted nuclease of predicted toxin-antitoxin system